MSSLKLYLKAKEADCRRVSHRKFSAQRGRYFSRLSQQYGYSMSTSIYERKLTGVKPFSIRQAQSRSLTKQVAIVSLIPNRNNIKHSGKQVHLGRIVFPTVKHHCRVRYCRRAQSRCATESKTRSSAKYHPSIKRSPGTLFFKVGDKF